MSILEWAACAAAVVVVCGALNWLGGDDDGPTYW